MSDWRTAFPGAVAADHIRAWLDFRIREIQGGEIGRARKALEDLGWRINFDLNYVPLNALARIDGHAEAACEAMADGNRTSAAVDELGKARRIVTLGAS